MVGVVVCILEVKELNLTNCVFVINDGKLTKYFPI
jgi:hypothetical protein